MGTEISKLLVFVESPSWFSPRQTETLAKMRDEHRELHDIVDRGGWVDRVLADLQQEAFHMPFVETHQELISASAIPAFRKFLSLAIKFHLIKAHFGIKRCSILDGKFRQLFCNSK